MKQAHLGLHRGQVGLVVPRLDVQDDHRLGQLRLRGAPLLRLLDNFFLGLGGGELLGGHLAEEVELVVVVGVRVGVGDLGSGGLGGGGGSSSGSTGSSAGPAGNRDALAGARERGAEQSLNVGEPAGGGRVGLGVRARGQSGEDGEVVAGGLVAVVELKRKERRGEERERG